MDQSYRVAGTWPWKMNPLPGDTGTVVVDVCSSSTLQGFSGTPTCDALRFLLEKAHEDQYLVKLLLPVVSGYMVQSDFLARRMIDCLDVAETRGFVAPGQRVEGCTRATYESMTLLEVLPHCYGAVVVQKDKTAQVNEELAKRISLPWLSPSPIGRKRVAVVGGGTITKLQGFAVAAASLNVALVIFEDPEHWASSDAYSHIREGFVPLDMTVDAAMDQRIAAALSEYQQRNTDGNRLDGIMTVDEHLLTIVSRAAKLLGFNTSPPEAVGLAQNKFQTRQLDTNVYCRLVRSMADLEHLLEEDGPRLQYPLIVKPSKGWSSEGVWKVSNEQELRAKVPMLWQDVFTAWHGRDVVVETYVDGPEVDANMVLVDGKVVFFEVNDDFPSPGDYDHDDKANGQKLTPVANFVETSNMLPSALPPSELEALQQRLHELALAAGFRDGVLHMEARLRNSSCHYTKDPDDASNSDGLVDLKLNPLARSTTRPEDVFLLEINPRQPGWQEIEATAHTYGVSYYSLTVLHALGDRDRIVALSRPFVGGAQYHMQLLFVSAQKGGIYRSGDVCSTVLRSEQGRRLAAHVVKAVNLMEDGQEVPDPRTGMVYGNFIAFFLIVSRTSRREAMRIGREIEQLVRMHTDGF